MAGTPPHFSFLGSQVADTIVACPLYGITLAQAIWYFRHYPQDSRYLKFLVLLLLILDGGTTLSLVLAVQDTALSPMKPSLDFTISGLVDIFFSTFIVTFVQGLYIHRVHIMSDGSWPITIVLGILTLLQFGSGIGVGTSIRIQGNTSKLHVKLSDTFIIIQISAMVACDGLISMLMAYYLNRMRTGIHRTEALVDQVIMYMVGIGTLTSIFTLATLIAWFAIPGGLVAAVLQTISIKLYVNSLLVTLNARNRLRHLSERTVSLNAIPMSTLVARSELSPQYVASQ